MFLAFACAHVVASDTGSESWWFSVGPTYSGATSQAAQWGKTPTLSWTLSVRADVLPRQFAGIHTSTSWRKKGLIQNSAVLPLPLWKVINIKHYNHSAAQNTRLGTRGEGSARQFRHSPDLHGSQCMHKKEGVHEFAYIFGSFKAKIKPICLFWLISMAASI